MASQSCRRTLGRMPPPFAPDCRQPHSPMFAGECRQVTGKNWSNAERRPRTEATPKAACDQFNAPQQCCRNGPVVFWPQSLRRRSSAVPSIVAMTTRPSSLTWFVLRRCATCSRIGRAVSIGRCAAAARWHMTGRPCRFFSQHCNHIVVVFLFPRGLAAAAAVR
jgi:hypothetical protein